MDWIKKHYDGVVLAVAALIALACATVALLGVFSFPDIFAERNSAKPRDNNVARAEIENLVKAAESISQHPKWEGHDGSLFVSRVYILKGGELVDPIEGDRPLHPPVPNEWLLKFDLDYTQMDILQTDVDGDGFTVLEEWRAGTDPVDPNSTPPLWTKIRLKNFERIPFKVKFSGTPDGGETFTINFIDDRTQPTQFLTLGQSVNIAGVPYTLTKFEPKRTVVNEIERDVSELTIENKATGETIILVNDQIVDSPTTFATFINLLDGKLIENIKRGETFFLPQEPETTFQLEEISEEQAVVIKVPTGERLEIPKL